MRRASSVKRASPANPAGSFSLAYLFPHVGDTMSDHGTILIPAELNSKGEKYSFRSVNAFGSVHEQFGVWIKAVESRKSRCKLKQAFLIDSYAELMETSKSEPGLRCTVGRI